MNELVSKVAKEANLGNFPKLYRYRYKAVPVQPTRGQPVPVKANRMQPVPVHLYRYRCAQNAQNVVFLYN